MKTPIIAALTLFMGLVAADCHGDNCANHVTGTFAGIGVPISARISLCNSFLRTTVRPPPRTVTSTFTKFILHPSESDTATATTRSTTSAAATGTASALTSANSSTNTFTPTTSASTTRHDQLTIIPSVVPTFATSQCPEDGQFASACKCWTRVTARTATLPASTVTVTATVSVNVACSPAATAVSNTTRFPCSNGFGMCSCLRAGDGRDDSGVCVRVGSGFFDDPGSTQDGPGDSSDDAPRTLWDGEHEHDQDRAGPGPDTDYDEDGVSPANWNVTGPCWFARECGVDHSCRGGGNVCVFDGSCACGRRRCYQAVAGCRGMDMPSYEAIGAS